MVQRGISACRFATWVEELLKMAIELGLQMNYNTEVTKLIEAEDGSFTLTTKDGRVISRRLALFLTPFSLPASCYLDS